MQLKIALYCRSFHNLSATKQHLGCMLKVHIERFNDSALVKCVGRLVHGDEADLLRLTVDGLTEASIAVDLSEVESFDAAGLGTLVYLQHQLETEGREFVLLSPPEYFLRLLRLTGLDEVLTIAEASPA